MTDVLAEVSGRLTKAWWLDAFGQYNTNEGRYEKYSAGVRYHPEAGKTLNFGYRYNRNYVNYDYLYDPDVSYVDTGLKQIDLSGQWPLLDRWYGLGRINYSFIDDDLLEGLAGLEYDAGCWAARLVAHRYVVDDDTRTRVMFEIELADLAHLGSNPLQILQRSIPGFEPTSKEE
jgi:LPS-assembly protein